MKFKFGIKEAVTVLCLAILIAVTILAGVFDDVEEMVDPNISLNIDGTWRTNETLNNVTPNKGKVWQVVEVRISNMNNKSSFQVSVPHFYAYTESEEKLWVFNGEDYSYDPIDPGEEQTVSLIFHVDESASLVRLEYIQKISSPAICEIPEPVDE